MSQPTLFIGNKNYSSWSFRAWIGLAATGIEFEENLQPFDLANQNRHFREFSPTGKVPVLVDSGITIWESLAILEYASERYPEARLWPQDASERAVARSISHEMHAGFEHLRAACPMDVRRKRRAIEVSEAVRRDVRRIETLWADCLQRSGGPFLFKRFTIADAMYAPVIHRFQSYRLSDLSDTLRYTKTMTGLSSWQSWESAARAEPDVVGIDEEQG